MSDALSSLIIPVYGNSETIAPLIEAVEGIDRQIDGDLEVRHGRAIGRTDDERVSHRRELLREPLRLLVQHREVRAADRDDVCARRCKPHPGQVL